MPDNQGDVVETRELYVPVGYITETFQAEPPGDHTMHAEIVSLVLPAHLHDPRWCARVVIEDDGRQHLIIHPGECYHEEFDDAEEG